MLDKLRQMEENYHAMQEKMMDPDVVGDNQQYAADHGEVSRIFAGTA